MTECRLCGAKLDDGDGFQHFCPYHPSFRTTMDLLASLSFRVHEAPSHFDGAAREFIFTPTQQVRDVRTYMRGLVTTIRDHISTDDINGIFHLDIQVRFDRPFLGSMNSDPSDEITHDFTSSMMTVASLSDLTTWSDQLVMWMDGELDKFTKMGSGWRVINLRRCRLRLSSAPVFGGRGGDVPEYLKQKTTRWVRVLKNDLETGYCFQDAIHFALAYQDIRWNAKLAKIRTVRQLRKMELGKHYALDFSRTPRLRVPIGSDPQFDDGLFRTDDLKHFEEKNNIIVRCYIHDFTNSPKHGFKGPLYVNTLLKKESTRVVHILLVTSVNKDTMLDGHYIPIVNPSMMARSFYMQRLGNSHNENEIVCELCLRLFTKASVDADSEQYDAHLKRCSEGYRQLERMPTRREIRFDDFSKTTRPLNVLYVDTESRIYHDSPESDPLHECAFIGSYLRWHEDLRKEYEEEEVLIDEGPECVSHFMKRLEAIVNRNIDITDETTRRPMSMTWEEEVEVDAQRTCQMCGVREDRLHRDHDHISGKFLQMLCANCNMRRRQCRNSLTVFMHNFKGYDAHQLMLQGFAKLDPDLWELSPVYQRADKLISLCLIYHGRPLTTSSRHRHHFYRVIFRDSAAFMPTSLDKMTRMLPEKPVTTSLMQREYGLSPNDLGKGIYPYSYFNDWKRMEDPQLPPIECFFNDLREEACPDSDYAKAQAMWVATGCRTLRDYTRVYLKLDVTLLTDGFEHFREQVYKTSGLDAIHYCGMPGLTYSFCFKYLNLRLETLQDPTQYTFFEEGIRGGMSFVNQHHSKRRIATVGGEQHQHLFYVDANALYTSALTQRLPMSGFRWMSLEEVCRITDDFMRAWDPETDDGFTVRVDLAYPPDVQDRSKDLPYAPHPETPELHNMPPFMQELWGELHGGRAHAGSRKLMLTHKDKLQYVVHHQTLKYYVEKGMRITHVYEGIHYLQRAFIKPYAEFHTLERSKTDDEVKRQLHKDFTNCTFGKMIENKRKYNKSKLVRSRKLFQRYSHNPLVRRWFPIGKDAIVLDMYQTDVVLDKPIYVGQTVLDLSKIIMYRILDAWQANPHVTSMTLLGGDTDSFFIQATSPVERNTLLAWFFTYPNAMDPEARGVLDTSNYPPTHPLFTRDNKSRLGCFKDEACGDEIQEFICLSPKQYSFEKVNGQRENRAKGVKRYKKDTLSHLDYWQAYSQHQTKCVRQTLLQSKHHMMRTRTQYKKALSVWEDKRAWIGPNESLPYGHHTLSEPLGIDGAEGT